MKYATKGWIWNSIIEINGVILQRTMNTAQMAKATFNYADDEIQLLTAFEEIARLDTSTIDSYMILACDGGRIEVEVNGSKHHLGTYEALILPPRTRLSNYMASPGVRLDLAMIKTDTVKRLLSSHIEEWERCIYINKNNHIVTTDESRQQFFNYVELLSSKLQQSERKYNREIVQGIIRCILFEYLEVMMQAVPTAEDITVEGQHKVLFKRFLELLTSRHVKHQLVDTYAQELCVSPNYLTKVCKEVTGKTAMMWIREYTESDIRYYLVNSDLSIKEICDDLGFPNLSFFGKYCRRAFGMSPSDFRKKMKN